MTDHPAPTPTAEDRLTGLALVLSRVDSLLTDAESAWFVDRIAARQLVQRAHQLVAEALR